MTQLSPEEEQRARQTLKVLAELKEKTEILSEHVESRKHALEEEIEESLHEAIQNARDMLEKVQENIEPKIKGIIQDQLDVIKKQMDLWKNDSVMVVQEEIEKKSDALNQRLLKGLDNQIKEKLVEPLNEIQQKIEIKLKSQIEESLKDFKTETDLRLASTKQIAFIAIVVSVFAIGFAVANMFLK